MQGNLDVKYSHCTLLIYWQKTRIWKNMTLDTLVYMLCLTQIYLVGIYYSNITFDVMQQSVKLFFVDGAAKKKA